MQISRKLSMIVFAVLAVLALAACVCASRFGQFAPMSGAAAAPALPDEGWRITYSTTTDWGRTAAESLAAALESRIDIPVYLQPADGNTPVGDDQPTITIGQVVGNASTSSVLLYYDQLGDAGWIISPDDPHVHLIAFSAEAAQDAIDALCADLDRLGGRELIPASLTRQTCYGSSSEGELAGLLESKIPLTFNPDGSFKLVLFSDVSAGVEVSSYTVAALTAIIEAEKPDLVLLAGGSGDGFSTRAELTTFLTALTAPLETAGIPWAHLYGGADTLPRAVKDEVYAAFAHCVSGTGDYFLPVTAGGELRFGVWMLSLPESGAGDYTPAQLASFATRASAALTAAGGTLPTIMALASPLPEFAEAAASPTSGEIGEAITIPALNSGLFSMARTLGVRGIYAGHDHLNSYAGVYADVELGALASLGYDGYGFGGTFDTNNRLRGGRVVEVTLDGAITSRMVYAKDYGIER